MPNTYVKIDSGIIAEELADLIAVCKQEGENQRPAGLGYPGATLKDISFIMPTLKALVDKVVAKEKWNTRWGLQYDLGAGSGVNFLQMRKGDKLEPHHDVPLYQLDENYQIKPEFANRECAVVLILNLNSDGFEGGEFAFVDPTNYDRTFVELLPGEALVYLGGSYTQVSEVTSGTKYQLAAFFCN